MMGRPKIPKQERKAKITGFRLKLSERKLIERAASIESKTLSKWVRFVLVRTAARQLREASQG
jgi:uncharacterized protein (DUF1778 family)